LNVERGRIERPLKPMIRFATPAFDRHGAKRGIIVLNYLGNHLLDRLTRASAGFPGVIWLLNRQGFFLRGPNPRAEWGFMLGHSRTFATRFPDEWPRLAGAQRGQFHTDEGLFTFRALPLPSASAVGLPSGPAASRPARDPAAAWLIIVAHVPPSLLDGS